MNEFIEKIKTLSVIVKSKERLPYGTGSRGRLIPSEKGRRAIFVPSFGALEKEEVDYLVEVSQEQEDERIKKGSKTKVKEEIEQVAQAMVQAPEGKRAKVGNDIIKGSRR